MPLPDNPWSTSYPTSQDTVGVEQSDLTPDTTPGAEDGHRILVSHFHALRDKLQAAAQKLGDGSNLPAGSVGAKVAALESAPPSHASSHEPGGGDAMTVDAVAGTGSLRTLGTGAQQACGGSDSRLSDARTPTSHASSHEPGGGDSLAVDAVAGTGSLRTLGTGAQQACAGNDSRLSDSRTPTSHASSHQNGGSDEISTATPAASAIPKADGSGKLDSWISDSGASTKGLIQLAEDLGGTATAPTIEGLGGDPLPSDVSNGFLKRNSANDAWEEVAYGSSANTVCQGDDSRLSDTRTPTSHASSHQDGGGDEVATATPAAAAVPKADGSGKLDSWISDSGASTKGLIQLAEDLGGTATAPTVEGLGGDPLPSDSVNGFLKRNAANDAWEEVAYGSSANTVCEGNDSRLSDARTPTSHASSHENGGGDEISVAGLSGELADPQPAKNIGTPVTAQASTPLTLTASDTGKVYTNEGASAQIVFNLPTAAVGLNFTFVTQDADGIQIVAASGDTIRIAASATPAAGNISNTTIGNTVQLVAINATEWIATYYVGTWTVSS